MGRRRICISHAVSTRNQINVCTLSLTSLFVKLYIAKQKSPRNGEQELIIQNNEDPVRSISGDNISNNEVTTGVKRLGR